MFQLLYINYPSFIQPEIINGLPFRWYGLMYIVAFSVAYFLFRYQVKKKNPLNVSLKQAEDMLFTGIVFLLIGARLGYVLFYNLGEYLANPLFIIWPFSNGQFVGIQGLSFHGGVIGGLFGVWFYCYRHKIKFLPMADLIAASIPFGYFFGRIGNFTNAELYGKVSGSATAMLFPNADLVPAYEGWVQKVAQKAGITLSDALWVNLPRYPSQLYEAFFEGIVLGLFLWFVVRKFNKVPGGVFAWFLIGYGVIRFFIEYFREPDAQLGFIVRLGPGADTPQVFTSLLNFSMGQLLCFLMVLGGAGLYAVAQHSAKQHKGL